MNLFDRLIAPVLGTSAPEPRPPDRDPILLETEEGRTWSGRAMDALSARFAHVLRAGGVDAGDRVAVQVEKSPEALALYLAVLRLGAVYLPLNPAYTTREVAAILEDSEPAVFVGPHACGRVAAEGSSVSFTCDARGGGTLLDAAPDAPSSFESVPRRDDDLAAIVYTSGTTGRPKGAMLTHGNLAANATALAQAWHLGPDDRLLHVLPIYHVHGLFVALHTVLLTGGSFLWLPRFEVEAVLTLLPRATVFMGVPTHYVRLLADPRLDRERSGGVRLFVSGSAPLSAETHRRFEERTGHAILERYGMTETGMNASNPYDGKRVAGTVGPPLAGVRIRITDPGSGRALPDGEVGMIEVAGPNVFPGYWRMPQATRVSFRPDGFFVTGDLGRFDELGYLSILGRDKDLVITGGLNVYPKEVEEVLEAIPGVVEAAVIGVPHPDFGEAVVAVIVEDPSPNAPLSDAEILATLREQLAAFKCPKTIVRLERLPRNAMGKVEKNALRAAHAGLFAG